MVEKLDDKELKFGNQNTTIIDIEGNVMSLDANGFITVKFNSAQNVQFASAQSVEFDSAQDVNISSGSVSITGTSDVTIASQDIDIYTTGLRAPRTDQTVKNSIHKLTAQSAWQTIYTVTTGKTLYVNQVIISNPASGDWGVQIGESSTADMNVQVRQDGSEIITLATPLVYTTATVVQGYTNDPGYNQTITIIGWEE